MLCITGSVTYLEKGVKDFLRLGVLFGLRVMELYYGNFSCNSEKFIVCYTQQPMY